MLCIDILWCVPCLACKGLWPQAPLSDVNPAPSRHLHIAARTHGRHFRCPTSHSSLPLSGIAILYIYPRKRIGWGAINSETAPFVLRRVPIDKIATHRVSQFSDSSLGLHSSCHLAFTLIPGMVQRRVTKTLMVRRARRRKSQPPCNRGATRVNSIGPSKSFLWRRGLGTRC